jgi:hypothetical protein
VWASFELHVGLARGRPVASESGFSRRPEPLAFGLQFAHLPQSMISTNIKLGGRCRMLWVSRKYEPRQSRAI